MAVVSSLLEQNGALSVACVRTSLAMQLCVVIGGLYAEPHGDGTVTVWQMSAYPKVLIDRESIESATYFLASCWDNLLDAGGKPSPICHACTRET